MESLLPIIIQLIAGAIGGNAAGAAMKGKSLGGGGNSIAGAIGGVVLGQIVERRRRMRLHPQASISAA
jgi:hypothetical protein